VLASVVVITTMPTKKVDTVRRAKEVSEFAEL
jgi:hypothetical protein